MPLDIHVQHLKIRDIKRLGPGEKLNDALVDYLAQSITASDPETLYLSSAFYTKLSNACSGGSSELWSKLWSTTDKVYYQDHFIDYTHWQLLVVPAGKAPSNDC